MHYLHFPDSTKSVNNVHDYLSHKYRQNQFYFKQFGLAYVVSMSKKVSFQTIQFTICTQFNCQKHFYFKLFGFVKQFYFKQFSLLNVKILLNIVKYQNTSILNNSF